MSINPIPIIPVEDQLNAIQQEYPEILTKIKDYLKTQKNVTAYAQDICGIITKKFPFDVSLLNHGCIETKAENIEKRVQNFLKIINLHYKKEKNQHQPELRIHFIKDWIVYLYKKTQSLQKIAAPLQEPMDCDLSPFPELYNQKRESKNSNWIDPFYPF